MTRRWIILPGMGATSAMYNGLRHVLNFEVNFVNWPAYKDESSYAQVAQRVIDENDITAKDVVGGSSLGGMVALEVVKKTAAKQVVLIGSAVHSGEVQSMLSLLSPLAALTPMAIVQALVGKNKNLVSAMFADSDPNFIRAMSLYLPSWPGFQSLNVTIYRVHGRKDHVIPCPSVACDIVENAGHLIAITHFKEVAAFLERVRTEIESVN